MSELVHQVSSALLQAFEALGLDTARIAQAAQLGPTQPPLSDRRSFDFHMALWDQAILQSQDRNLALKVAPLVALDYEVLAHEHCEAGMLLEQFLPLYQAAMATLSTASRIELRPEDNGTRVVYGLTRPPWRMPRYHAEAVIAILYCILRRLSGAVVLSEVTFQHSAPTKTVEHGAFFGCSVWFGEPNNSLLVPKSSLVLPARPPAKASGLSMPTSGVPAAADILVAAVRQEIVASMGSGDLTMGPIAARLGQSALELRRALAARGMAYAQILTSVRRELARAYLHDLSWNLSDIAVQLGFSSAPSFRRAFQRWTGCTPGEYRRCMLG